MKLVNILEAKTDFSKLVRQIETGEEDTIIVARYGNPIAKLTAYEKVPVEKRFGIAKGKLQYPDDIDECNEEIADMFGI